MAVELRASLGKLSGDPQQDVKVMYNYVMQLTEELRYALNNIGISNLNDKELARYENGRLSVFANEIELHTNELRLEFGTMTDQLRDDIGSMEAELYGAIEASASGLRVEFAEDLKLIDEELGEVADKVTTLELSAGGLKLYVDEMLGSFGVSLDNMGDEIDGLDADLAAKYASLSSLISAEAGRIDLIVQGIGRDGTVDAASIMLAINADGSEVKISGDKIVFEGDASFVTKGELKDGETVISGNNVKTGEIRGAKFVALGNDSGKIGTAFVAENWHGQEIGYIGYQYYDVDEEYRDKLWLRTDSYNIMISENPYEIETFYPSIKLEAAGGVSIHSKSGHGIFLYDKTVEWMFKGGHLYRDGVQVL